MTKEKLKNFKRMFGLLAPIVILIITITVTSISFAWFSKDAKAVVEPINLTTSDVFTLTFGNITSENTVKYNGENSYEDGFLIHNRRAFASPDNTGKGFTPQDKIDKTPAYENYILNDAYVSKNTVKFDTEGKPVDFNIIVSGFEIWSRDEIDPSKDFKKYPTDDALIKTEDDVALLCTWYMKKQNDADIITPYGTIKESWLENTGTEAADFPWTVLPSKTSKNGFTADKNDVYELYLIFAPEKLFWKQLCYNDWKQPLTEVYTDEERKIISDPANSNRFTDRPFYATPIYIGDSFEFNVKMYVEKINDGGAV